MASEITTVICYHYRELIGLSECAIVGDLANNAGVSPCEGGGVALSVRIGAC
jgi:hypothetical protein